MRVFKLGLPAMNRTYASIYGTAAIQLKDIPPRPTKYDGCVTLFNVPSADEASVSDDLSRFGEVVDVTLKAGQASVRFASHEQAERCVGLRFLLCLVLRQQCELGQLLLLQRPGLKDRVDAQPSSVSP